MNPDRHFYLYAKGHYKETDVVEDLKAVVSERSNIDAKYVRVYEIASTLLSLTRKHISEVGFERFMLDLAPENRWKIGAEEYDDYWTALFKNCLSVLRFVVPERMNLGEPDPDVLPLKRERD